jgi:hypothetical protein
MKLKEGVRKDMANMETGNNKIGNKDRIEKINEASILFFEKTNRIKKSLESVTRKEETINMWWTLQKS